MRTEHLHPLAIAAAALVNLAGSVAAQDKPTAVLNRLAVRLSRDAAKEATARRDAQRFGRRLGEQRQRVRGRFLAGPVETDRTW